MLDARDAGVYAICAAGNFAKLLGSDLVVSASPDGETFGGHVALCFRTARLLAASPALIAGLAAAFGNRMFEGTLPKTLVNSAVLGKNPLVPIIVWGKLAFLSLPGEHSSRFLVGVTPAGPPDRECSGRLRALPAPNVLANRSCRVLSSSSLA